MYKVARLAGRAAAPRGMPTGNRECSPLWRSAAEPIIFVTTFLVIGRPECQGTDRKDEPVDQRQIIILQGTSSLVTLYYCS